MSVGGTLPMALWTMMVLQLQVAPLAQFAYGLWPTSSSDDKAVKNVTMK